MDEKYIDISVLAEKFIPNDTDIIRVQDAITTYKLPLSELFRRIVSTGNLSFDTVNTLELISPKGTVNQDMDFTGSLALLGMRTPQTVLSPEFTTLGQIWYAPAGLIVLEKRQGLKNSGVTVTVESPFGDVSELLYNYSDIPRYSDGTNIKLECTFVEPIPDPGKEWEKYIVEVLTI